MDFLAALEILRNAPIETFKNHSSQTLSTIQHMKKMVGDGSAESTIPPTSQLCDQASNNHEMTTAAGASKQTSDKDRSAELFKELLKNLPYISRLSKKLPTEIIAKRRAKQRDERLNDILRLEGRKSNKVTDTDKLLRGVAQRSLALQYSRHQDRIGETKRVSEICEFLLRPDSRNKDALHKRRGGKIRSWVARHLNFTKEDQNIIVLAISSGIKQLVVENLLQQRLEQVRSSLNAAGISAATALTMHKFKALKLEEIPSFIDSIIEMSSENTVSSDHLQKCGETSTVSLICENSSWFKDFQREYDQKIFSTQRLGLGKSRASPPLSGEEIGNDETNIRSGTRRDQHLLSPPASSSQNQSASDCSTLRMSPAYTLESPTCAEVPTNPEADKRAPSSGSTSAQQEILPDTHTINVAECQNGPNNQIPGTGVHHSGPSSSDSHIGEISYQACPRFRPPKDGQGMQGVNQHPAGLAEERAAPKNLVYGFDDHSLAMWPLGQPSSNFGIQQSEYNCSHNAAIGFESYGTQSAADPVGLRNKYASLPGCVRGFDTPQLNSTHRIGSLQDQADGDLLNGFISNAEPVSWNPCQVFGLERLHNEHDLNQGISGSC